MQTVYAVSKWNNASRARTRHLDNGEGLPACGARPKAFSWGQSEGEPTCEACKRIADTQTLKKAVLLLTKSLVAGNPLVHQDGYGGTCFCDDCETVRRARRIAASSPAPRSEPQGEKQR